jgi:ERCC4-type nuclease
VLYDHREERSTIPGLLALEGLQPRGEQLPVGDYVLSERLAVERKTGADLIASIKDRRLWEQLDRLKAAYPAVVLIIEGRPAHFPAEGWKGALASALAMGGVSVLATRDVDETVEWLARLARREQRGPSQARGAKRKSKDPDRLAESVLASLPGVSGKGAQRLLEHFGSLADVFAAGERELRAVPGIGPKRARELAALSARRWRQAPWD